MLAIQNLVKKFRSYTAVNDISFHVEPGKIIGLIGPNGAGKTTTLRCLTGILKPTSGKVLVEGIDLHQNPVEAKKKLAFVPEVPVFYDLLTVGEHLWFIAMSYQTLDYYDKLSDTLLNQYQLLDKKYAPLGSLSKGTRQKVSMVAALIHNPSVLLLDEPIMGVDPVGYKIMKDQILEAKKNGLAILLSTHLLSLAEEICDEVIILKQGNKLAQGSLKALQQENHQVGQNLESVFLELIESELKKKRPLE